MSFQFGANLSRGGNASEARQSNVDPIGRFMKIKDVCTAVGLSRTSIYRLMNSAEHPFPKPVKIGKSSRWCEHQIVEWKKTMLAAQN